jgi:hypothetical protein
MENSNPTEHADPSNIAEALRDTLKYSNQRADGENVVDGLFAIAKALNRLAAAVEYSNRPGR